MARKLVLVGVLYLASIAAAGVLDIRNEVNEKPKEPEKKPPIIRDYVCLREGDLCHPEYARNRGLYVSCSNGVAWELQCPKCAYHPLNCPTRTLWFDGEKCDWASPKLASQPCLDRFPSVEAVNVTEKDGSVLSEHDVILQTLQAVQVSNEQVEKNKWQVNPMSVANGPVFYKSPKSADFGKGSVSEEDEEIADNKVGLKKETKVAPEIDSAEDDDSSEEVISSNKIEGKSEQDTEPEPDFPTYLNAEDSMLGSKIVRLSDPVYTLVNNPDGSGKQVLMRVSQPFVLEDPARSLSILPNLNVISSFSDSE